MWSHDYYDYLHEAPDVNVGGLLITDRVEANDVEGEIKHIDAAELSASKMTVATLLREEIKRKRPSA